MLTQRSCLFRVFRPTREFFTHMETSTIPVKSCKLLNYTRDSWPLSREGSSACHYCCYTGHPFKMVISDDPRHSHLFPSDQHNPFLRLRSVETGIRTPHLEANTQPSVCVTNALTYYANLAAHKSMVLKHIHVHKKYSPI